MPQKTLFSSRDWFTEAMESLKVYFPQNAGDGEFWQRRIRHYQAILDVDKDEMKNIVRHIAETRKYPTFPAAADLREIKFQLRNASYPGADPAEEREKERIFQDREWIDRGMEEFNRLPPQKRAFIRKLPGGAWPPSVVCLMKGLEAGTHPKSVEWRELG